MKNLKPFTLLLILPLFSISLISCVYSVNMGPIVDQKRNVGEFEGIRVSTGIDVFLTQGDRNEVVVKANEDIIDDVETNVDNGILKVYIDRKQWFKGFGDVDVYITFDEINSLDISSGSDVESQKMLKFREIDIEASSGSDLKLDLEASSVILRVSSGSDASLTGSAKSLTAKASSGSDIQAYEFEVENADIECSSGSDVKTWATKSLNVKASSGSDVYYKGNPELQNISTSGGSDVHQRSF